MVPPLQLSPINHFRFTPYLQLPLGTFSFLPSNSLFNLIVFRILLRPPDESIQSFLNSDEITRKMIQRKSPVFTIHYPKAVDFVSFHCCWWTEWKFFGFRWWVGNEVNCCWCDNDACEPNNSRSSSLGSGLKRSSSTGEPSGLTRITSGPVRKVFFHLVDGCFEGDSMSVSVVSSKSIELG